MLMQPGTNTMRFVKHEIGASANKMVIAHTGIPSLQDGQVLVSVKSFGINRADTLQRQGKYPPPPGESEVLGLEVSGVVVAHANDVKNVQIGQAVFGLVAGGGYAEYVAVDARHLLPIPANCNFVQAAGIAEVFLTAYQCLFMIGNLTAQQNVLVHAGASAVGLAAVQLAALKQCAVAVTTSNQQKANVCLQLGATHAVIYPQQDFVESLKTKGFKADVVIDVVGGDYLNRNLKVLALDGKIIQLAMLNGRYSEPLDIALLLGKRATIHGSTLRNRNDAYKAELIQRFAEQCLTCFDNHSLKPNIYQTLSVNDVAQAHNLLEQNNTIGKLICSW